MNYFSKMDLKKKNVPNLGNKYNLRHLVIHRLILGYE